MNSANSRLIVVDVCDAAAFAARTLPGSLGKGLRDERRALRAGFYTAAIAKQIGIAEQVDVAA